MAGFSVFRVLGLNVFSTGCGEVTGSFGITGVRGGRATRTGDGMVISEALLLLFMDEIPFHEASVEGSQTDSAGTWSA
jgi:hypothetical protein